MCLLGPILFLFAQDLWGHTEAPVPALASPHRVSLDMSRSASKLESGDAEPQVSEHGQSRYWEGERRSGISSIACCLVIREDHGIARTGVISGVTLFVRQKVSIKHQSMNVAGRRGFLLHVRSCQEKSCSVQPGSLDIIPCLIQGRLCYCVYYAQDLI